MRIRIIAPGSVSDGAGLRAQGGQIVDVAEDLARGWIAAGHAEAAPEERRTAGRTGKQAATRRAPRKAAAASPAAPDASAPGDDGTQT
ncbi:hypothetical protein [Streptomyces sp. NPDC008125]|uniref:hypothetical protein n=1 Tax=Streptomyces sp. NPDC008125 TaxID=3364811 RepID=UPI0036E5D185